MPTRPNVLVFFTDQQRWDTCGCHGANPMGLTPVPDRMAARGTLVPRSFTTQPVRGPARARRQTGRQATQTGCWKNSIPPPPSERTIVHFRGDHGGHFRTRNGEHQRSCHENSIRGPIAFRGPRFDRGAVVEELVSPVDWRATLLDAAGLAVPAAIAGRSVPPLLDGRAEGWPGEGFVQISESRVGRAVRTDRRTYAVRAPDADGAAMPSSDVSGEDAPSDLATDPAERDTLVARPEPRPVADDLVETLNRRMVEAGEAVPEIRPAAAADARPRSLTPRRWRSTFSPRRSSAALGPRGRRAPNRDRPVLAFSSGSG